MRTCLLASALVLLSGVALSAADSDPGQIDKLVHQLGDEELQKRQEAAKELEAIGEPALPALRKTVKSHIDPDVRLRAALLVRNITEGFYTEIKALTGTPTGYWLNRVTFTSDGKQAIATGGGVIWYDLETGKEVRRVLELQFGRRGFDLSSDGKLFITGHQNDKVIHIGEVETGKEVARLEGHTAGVSAVVFSRDGTLAASASGDRTIRLWDLKTGKELRQAKGVKSAASSLAFSPDGTHLLSGHANVGTEYSATLWDVKTGEEVRSFSGHKGILQSVKFLADGKSILTSCMGGLLRRWDVESGKETWSAEHKGGIYDVAVSPDGKFALTAGYGDNTVRLWDPATGKELHRFGGHTIRVLAVAFSPDGKRALSSDANNTVRLWRVAK